MAVGKQTDRRGNLTAGEILRDLVGNGPEEVGLKIQGPRGFVAGGIAAGLKKSGAMDLGLIVSDRPAVTAAVTTQNVFCGAPVTVTRERLQASAVTRGVVVNAGCSNVARGEEGLATARAMAQAAGIAAGAGPDALLVASTGVIGVRLPLEKIEAGLPGLVAQTSADGWEAFAHAILTTDLTTKVARRTFKLKVAGKSETVTVLGVCKGSGMIQPNMATMLAFITTDYALTPALAKKALRAANARTLNCVTVDGDTSTSDMAILFANGAALGEAGRKAADAASDAKFERALGEVMEELAKAIARDGEGATRLVTVEVTGAATEKAAHQVAMTIANSPLVKTAIFGNDPNWGRIAAAAGRAGVPFDAAKSEVRLQGAVLLKKGQPQPLDREALIEAMKGQDVVLRFGMGEGKASARVWTCDMTYDYIRINAEYTT